MSENFASEIFSTLFENEKNLLRKYIKKSGFSDNSLDLNYAFIKNTIWHDAHLLLSDKSKKLVLFENTLESAHCDQNGQINYLVLGVLGDIYTALAIAFWDPKKRTAPQSVSINLHIEPVSPAFVGDKLFFLCEYLDGGECQNGPEKPKARMIIYKDDLKTVVASVSHTKYYLLPKL